MMININVYVQAFLKAWKLACGVAGGTVVVPAGTFYLKVANFQGPCKGPITFTVSDKAILKASDDPALTDDYWISFNEVDGLSVNGDGTINGNGDKSWPHKRCTGQFGLESCIVPPTSMKFVSVKNSRIQSINLEDSKMFHIYLYECENVLISNVGIKAPENSPNTDGIHIQHSSYINITDANIATGDDCISMADGCTNINITRVTCGPGHGISIGSLGKETNNQDVKGITVTNCTLSKTQNGLRIKTRAPCPPSTASDIMFSDIIIDNAQNPIIIDQHYCPDSPCHSGESSVQISGVKFIGVRGTSASEVGVNLDCSKTNPCKGITLTGWISLTKLEPPPRPAPTLKLNEVPSKCS